MKKIKSKKSNKEMAKVFRETGKWFLSLPEGALVDMTNVYSSAESVTCSTPSCFGGWLALKYKTGQSEYFLRHFADGANAFAEELGFTYRDDLTEYAAENPEIWGNKNGDEMFCSAYAFNEGDKEYTNETITTKAIGEKLIAVAKRLEETTTA